jgi:DNA-binding NarL/FixJ family response regulator
MTSVLIIDDHALITQGLTLALREEGFDVHATDEPDAEYVLALARVHRPALAIVDLQFSTSAHDGLALIAPLAELTKVVVLTGVVDLSVHGECLQAGAAGVLTKTVSFDELLDRLRAALRGETVNSVRECEDMLAAHRARRSADAKRFAAFEALSPREREVLELLATGMSAETIAERAFISLPTVRTHIQSILRKLDVNSQLAAVARVREAGWSLQHAAH